MTITAIRLNQPMLSKGTSNTSIPPCVKMQHRISSSLSLVLGRETSDLVSICQMTRDGRHLERNMDSSRESPPNRRDSHQSLSLSLCTLLSVSLLSARLVVGDQCQTQTFILLLVLLLPLALHSFFLLFAFWCENCSPFCDKN